jgi:hypothetical protein
MLLPFRILQEILLSSHNTIKTGMIKLKEVFLLLVLFPDKLTAVPKQGSRQIMMMISIFTLKLLQVSFRKSRLSTVQRPS